MRTHVAEMILDLRYRGPRDAFRKKHPFSEDIESVHAILFSSKYNKHKKRAVYTRWLEANQPCVFGRVAAKNKFVFVCLLEEDEILRMRRGDDDLRDTIQDHRQVWKRYALEGLSSSFVILVVSKSLVDKEPATGSKKCVDDCLSSTWKSSRFLTTPLSLSENTSFFAADRGS